MIISQEDKRKVIKFLKDSEKIVNNFYAGDINFKSAKGWLDGSEKEFETFRLIKTSNSLAPQSIYHLVLCVEKLVKCYGIFNNIITDKAAKHKIGHTSPRVFLKLIENSPMHSFLKIYVKNYSKIKPDEHMHKLKELFGKRVDEKTEEALAKLSKQDIIIIFKTIDSLSIKISEKFKNKTIKDAFNVQNNALIKSYFKSELMKQNVWDKVKDIKIDDLVDGPILNMYLFALAIITFPHHNSCRYLNAFDDKIIYNKELGIMANLDLIEEKTEKCIKLVKENLNLLEKYYLNFIKNKK